MLVLNRKDGRTSRELNQARRHDYFKNRLFEPALRGWLDTIDRKPQIPALSEPIRALRRESRTLEGFTREDAIVSRLRDCERLHGQIAADPFYETALYPGLPVDRQLGKLQEDASSLIGRLTISNECNDQLFQELAGFIERVNEARTNNISQEEADRLRIEFGGLTSRIERYDSFNDTVALVLKLISEADFHLDDIDMTKLQGKIPDRNYDVISGAFALALESTDPDSRKSAVQMENNLFFMVQIVGRDVRYLTGKVETSTTVGPFNIVTLSDTRGTHTDDIMIIPLAPAPTPETEPGFYILLKLDVYETKARCLKEVNGEGRERVSVTGPNGKTGMGTSFASINSKNGTLRYLTQRGLFEIERASNGKGLRPLRGIMINDDLHTMMFIGEQLRLDQFINPETMWEYAYLARLAYGMAPLLSLSDLYAYTFSDTIQSPNIAAQNVIRKLQERGCFTENYVILLTEASEISALAQQILIEGLQAHFGERATQLKWPKEPLMR